MFVGRTILRESPPKNAEDRGGITLPLPAAPGRVFPGPPQRADYYSWS